MGALIRFGLPAVRFSLGFCFTSALLAACSHDASHALDGAAAHGGGGRAGLGGPALGNESAGSSGPAAIGGRGGATGQAGTRAGDRMPKAGSGGMAADGGGDAGKAGSTGTRSGSGFYRMEQLQRGLVAVTTGAGIYLGWRMFGTEYDPNTTSMLSFNLYRDGAMIANVTDSTNYLDRDGTAKSSYSVRAVSVGVEQEDSEAATPWAQNYLRIPISPPGDIYSANDASAADLDGDGTYEIVLKWDPSDSKDNSQSGVTSDVYLDALTLAGKQLWRIDLGPNIRAGAHYTQFIVFDFDGDGKAEMAVKTAPGTKDGSGSFLHLGPAANDDDSAIYRNSDGYVLTGPEYLTVFAGDTGRELTTVDFDVPRGKVSDWGDDYGNRVDRFLAAAAYLDDTGLPSFVMARGYYTRTTLTAWNWRDATLSQLWKFDSNTTPKDDSGNPYTGQGSHSISVANIDADPQQEILYGAMAIDHDGRGKCSTGFNHGDALHVGDFALDHPGLEVFMPNEDGKHPAYHLRDANSCEILVQGPVNGNDTGRAVAEDIDPDNPGAEIWAAGIDGLLDAASGKRIGDTPASMNFVTWWDADETRELEDKTSITKYGAGTLLSCSTCASNNGTKATPSLSADLLGDWREEIIWREADNSALRLYTTTDVTARRIYTLMHDPQYRVAIAWQNVAYNQPPHPSFAIGKGIAAPPKPDIRTH
jgi:rhamnogalacturonan endolyase